MIASRIWRNAIRTDVGGFSVSAAGYVLAIPDVATDELVVLPVPCSVVQRIAVPLKVRSMFQSASNAIGDYFSQLTHYMGTEWTHMTPSKYGTLLVMIGVCGYLLMRSGGKS